MDRIRHGSVLLALQIVLLPASLLVISAFLFWVTVPVTFLHFPLALGVTIAVSHLLRKKNKALQAPVDWQKKDFLRVTMIFIALILVSLLVSLSVHDDSPEDLTRHQPAIQLFADGWNPFHDGLPGAVESSDKTLAGEAHTPAGTAHPPAGVAHTPAGVAGSWITAAAVYKMTGSIRAGKLFNILYLVLVFLVTFDYLFEFKIVPVKSKMLIAAVLALNPVALYQLFGFRIEGTFASLLGAVMILVFHYTMFRIRYTVILLAIALVTLINTAFSGLLYGLVLVVFSWTAVFIIDRDRQPRLLKFTAAAVLIAVVGIGFQPYVTGAAGALTDGSATGFLTDGSTTTAPAPEAFMGKNRFSQLFYSLFSQTDDRPDRMPRLKLPFSIAPTEIEAIQRGSPSYGGFGPLFGIAFLFIMVTAAILFRSKRLILLYVFIAAGMILLTTLLTSGGWQARSAPQLWLLPITFEVGFYYIHRTDYMHYIRGFALSLMLLNSLIVWGTYTSNLL